MLLQIDSLLEGHCRNCHVYSELRNKTDEKKAYRFCIDRCWVQKEMQRIANLSNEGEKKFSPGETFYLVNHIEILGMERGLPQVAKQLNRKVEDIEWKYFELQEKTRHMAV